MWVCLGMAFLHGFLRSTSCLWPFQLGMKARVNMDLSLRMLLASVMQQSAKSHVLGQDTYMPNQNTRACNR